MKLLWLIYFSEVKVFYTFYVQLILQLIILKFFAADTFIKMFTEKPQEVKNEGQVRTCTLCITD